MKNRIICKCCSCQLDDMGEPTETKVERLTVCLGFHSHVSWSYFITRENGEEVRKLDENSFQVLDESCKCLFPQDDEPKGVEYETYFDGDSGRKVICFGGLHTHFQCDEFGRGWDPTKHEDCDCQHDSRLIEIPEIFRSLIP